MIFKTGPRSTSDFGEILFATDRGWISIGVPRHEGGGGETIVHEKL